MNSDLNAGAQARHFLIGGSFLDLALDEAFMKTGRWDPGGLRVSVVRTWDGNVCRLSAIPGSIKRGLFGGYVAQREIIVGYISENLRLFNGLSRQPLGVRNPGLTFMGNIAFGDEVEMTVKKICPSPPKKDATDECSFFGGCKYHDLPAVWFVVSPGLFLVSPSHV